MLVIIDPALTLCQTLYYQFFATQFHKIVIFITSNSKLRSWRRENLYNLPGYTINKKRSPVRKSVTLTLKPVVLTGVRVKIIIF